MQIRSNGIRHDTALREWKPLRDPQVAPLVAEQVGQWCSLEICGLLTCKERKMVKRVRKAIKRQPP